MRFFKNFFSLKYSVYAVGLFFLLMQVMFFIVFGKHKVSLPILKNPPNERAVKALSLGDTQFYFRALSMSVQQAGDHYGEFTPLQFYDYKKLSRWFFLMDKLDSQSILPPTIAGYNYGIIEGKNDLIYLIDYLRHYARKDITKNWWWMVHAAYLADMKLKNKDLALEIAYEIKDTPEDAPVWVRYYPSILLTNMGEYEKADEIIRMVLNDNPNLQESDRRFLDFFAEHRIRGGEKEEGVKLSEGNN